MKLAVLSVLMFVAGVVKSKTPACDDAIGVSNGKIPDNQITASSTGDPNSYKPKLNQTLGGEAWCFNGSMTGHRYLEIDLGEVYRISAVVFHRRFIGKSDTNVSNFILMFRRDGLTSFYNYNIGPVEPFTFSNVRVNNSDVIRHELSGPHAMRYVRIVDLDDSGDTWCVQAELFGCPWKQGEGLIAYKMPQGQTRGGRVSMKVDLLDDTYDGQSYDSGVRRPLLKSGLGQLTDGVLGSDGFWDDLGSGPGFEWMGWYDMFNPSPYITFRYDSIREFHKVRFHVNNQIGNVKLFGKVLVSFSQEGEYFYHKFHYKPSKQDRAAVSKAFFVEVDLQKASGTYINFQFYYSGKWILFSEIEIDSAPVTNTTFKYPPPTDIDNPDQNDEDSDEDDIVQSAASKPRGKKSYALLIAGITSGVAVVILIIIILVIIHKRRQRKAESHTVQFRNRIPVHLANISDDKATKNNNIGATKVKLPPEESTRKGEDLFKPNNNEHQVKMNSGTKPWEKEDFSACKKVNTTVSMNPNIINDINMDKV